MLVPMTQLELLGHREQLDEVLRRLQQLRAVEVAGADTPPAGGAPAPAPAGDPPAGGPGPELREVADLLARVERLLELAAPDDPTPQLPPPGTPEPPTSALAEIVRQQEDRTDGLLTRLEQLRAEGDALPRSAASLAALLPLVPELAELSDAELADLHLTTIALVLDDPEGRVAGELRDQLTDALGDRFLLVTAAVDGGSVSCLLIVPSAAAADVEALLGRDRIARVTMPEAYAHRSLASTVTTMQARLAALPGELAQAEAAVREALAPAVPALRLARGVLAARAERRAAAAHADLGERTFALRAWTPRAHVTAVADALTGLDRPVVVAEVRARERVGTPPTLLRNSRLFRPFERLVGFLSWPGQGGLDPTGLMAVVLPLLFGIMVGDVGYGVLLVAIGWWARRRWGRRSQVADDAGRILVAGGAWSVVFGALYGELFGDLGRYALGMPALWFYRGGPDALTPLLLFVLGVGVAHVVLGLLLGLWTAVRERHGGHVAERLGTLLVLCGLFALAGVAVQALPGGAVPPAVAAVVVGIVLTSVVHGALGALLGPLEVIGAIGNVLSYLRLAAVGLASVYLAVVANELARQAPLLLGLVIAVFFHALNLALAAFSPMVQALRLHYVEFFGTFYEGGGRAFAPLGAGLPAAAAMAPPTVVPAEVAGPATVPAQAATEPGTGVLPEPARS
ncbi:V-type ATPase 116kDa subunit family protein [Geodermatophilus sp. DSM 44513]|uniref:V-type ATP synthase subunit I n=1 Tax=Geodermatophilus sp. DSM 44513 TaxID=1528104 RepID=UPI0028F71BCD|nr:V-type ATPase 116kDa subunit family protein [Geodermatophilus sp. DSM 44513]WNV77809.1 V-type ATPase 116kDa subunit family protein [Geodermatophilus sp. DSM 44513]